MLNIICAVEWITFNLGACDGDLTLKTQYIDDHNSILHIEIECDVFGTIYVMLKHHGRLKFGCLVFHLNVKL